MSVRPNPPAWETWIDSIGVVRMRSNAPTRSSTSRLPCESATGRSGASGFARGSTSTTERALPRSARARVATTGPPPATTTSAASVPARIAHQGLDVVDALGRLGRHDLAARRRDERVVLDAYADVPEPLGHPVRRAHVAARLHRQRHARH